MLEEGENERAKYKFVELLALKMTHNQGNDDLALRTLSTLGLVYRRLGDDIKAAKCYSEIIDRSTTPTVTSRAYESRADLFHDLGLQQRDDDLENMFIDKALDDYRSALAVPNHGLPQSQVSFIRTVIGTKKLLPVVT